MDTPRFPRQTKAPHREITNVQLIVQKVGFRHEVYVFAEGEKTRIIHFGNLIRKGAVILQLCGNTREGIGRLPDVPIQLCIQVGKAVIELIEDQPFEGRHQFRQVKTHVGVMQPAAQAESRTVHPVNAIIRPVAKAAAADEVDRRQRIIHQHIVERQPHQQVGTIDLIVVQPQPEPLPEIG